MALGHPGRRGSGQWHGGGVAGRQRGHPGHCQPPRGNGSGPGWALRHRPGACQPRGHAAGSGPGRDLHRLAARLPPRLDEGGRAGRQARAVREGHHAECPAVGRGGAAGACSGRGGGRGDDHLSHAAVPSAAGAGGFRGAGQGAAGAGELRQLAGAGSAEPLLQPRSGRRGAAGHWCLCHGLCALVPGFGPASGADHGGDGADGRGRSVGHHPEERPEPAGGDGAEPAGQAAQAGRGGVREGLYRDQ